MKKTAWALSVLLIASAKLSAAPADGTADRVLGQPDLTSHVDNNGGLSATSLFHPGDVDVTPDGRLYAVDANNSRILSWPSAEDFVDQEAADIVIGQPNFSSDTVNNGGVSAVSLYDPQGLAVDAAGNLYVADTFNNRVLEYDDPAANDTAADRVFGQTNFTNNTENAGGIGPSSLRSPQDVAVDPEGNVFIADSGNVRVLIYDTPLTTDRIADQVLGQPNFVSMAANNGGVTASSMSPPAGVAVDDKGNAYVADGFNGRVLRYANARTDAVADQVFGQTNFTNHNFDNAVISANTLYQITRVVIDSDGTLWIDDAGNYRLLRYDSPLTTDSTADFQIGQVDFTTGIINRNGIVGPSGLGGAVGMAFDAAGDLIVADSGNSRILSFDAPAAATTGSGTTGDATTGGETTGSGGGGSGGCGLVR